MVLLPESLHDTIVRHLWNVAGLYYAASCRSCQPGMLCRPMTAVYQMTDDRLLSDQQRTQTDPQNNA